MHTFNGDDSSVQVICDERSHLMGEVPPQMSLAEACFWFSVNNLLTIGFGGLVCHPSPHLIHSLDLNEKGRWVDSGVLQKQKSVVCCRGIELCCIRRALIVLPFIKFINRASSFHMLKLSPPSL
jgi:hypothetical protein